FNLVPRLAYYRKITLAGRSLQKLSPQSKINLRADKITAVPFVGGTYLNAFFKSPERWVAPIEKGGWHLFEC
ncbi:MAG: hypothetical protein ACK44Z_08160, partial [Pirellulaceae bacterium]